MKLILSLLFTSPVVQGIQVGFYLGAACKTQGLYSETYDEEISCREVPEAAASAQSVIAAGSGDNDNGLEVILYGTGDCKGTPIAAVSGPTVCVPNLDDVIKVVPGSPYGRQGYHQETNSTGD
jgi:hypothetical protein